MKNANDLDVKFYSKSDLAAIGIDVAQLLTLITRIDEENGLLEESYEAVVARLTPVFDATENMWRAIMINGKIKGYWNCEALNDEYTALIEKAQLKECYINIDNLKSDLRKEKNDLLFDSVCIHKDYQDYRLSGVIYKSIYDTLGRLPQDGIEVGDIWASIWSDQGVRFFTKLGFVLHKENEHNGAIYRVSFDDLMKNMEIILAKYGLTGG
jgi:hypothetical protein